MILVFNTNNYIAFTQPVNLFCGLPEVVRTVWKVIFELYLGLSVELFLLHFLKFQNVDEVVKSFKFTEE